MENLGTVVCSLKPLFAICKTEYYNNPKSLRIMLSLYLITYYILGFHLFYKEDIYLISPSTRIVFGLIYFAFSYFVICSILMELGLKKKTDLKSSQLYQKLLNIVYVQQEKYNLNKIKTEEEKLFVEIKSTVLKAKKDFNLFNNISIKQQENSNQIDLLKSKTGDLEVDFSFLKSNQIVTEKKVAIIEEQIFIKEKIIYYCSLKDIKALFLEYRNDLFENLDVSNFIKYMFKGEGEGELNKNVLYEDEINNILAIMMLLIQKEKIKTNNSVLFRLSKSYLKLDIKIRMFGININNKAYSLTNDKTEYQILKKITKFKNI